jgi:hypothetical protein
MVGAHLPDEVDVIAKSEKSSVSDRGGGYKSGIDRPKGEDVEVYTPTENKKLDEPPNGGKGWLMIACVATINGYAGR